jgi:hypothetical protein
LNVAVTVLVALRVTAQVAVPLQAPLQPAKIDPEAGLAVSVIDVPTGTASVQSAPHAMPAGVLVTVPAPVPFFVTDSVTEAPAVAEPLTTRDTVSPPAVTFTLPAKLPAVVGWKRTVMVWLAPEDREKEPPDTMLNGAPTLAAPASPAVPVFCTVKVRSTVLPVVTLPKLTEGVTVKSGWATPLTEVEHALSLPLSSKAVTRTKYVAPALRPFARWLTDCPDAGADVGDDTLWYGVPGHAGTAAARYIR